MDARNLLNCAKGNIVRTKVVEGMGLSDMITGGLGNFTTICIKDGKTGRVLYSGHNTTVLGGRVAQLEEIFGLTKNSNQHLLINDSLGVPHSESNNVLNSATQKRFCGYFMAGNGAASVDVPGKYYTPKNYETKLYNPIPFRMVPVTSDLLPSEQEQYRLRKIVVVNGVDYAAYYAKAFEVGNLILEYNSAEYSPLESDTTQVDENDSTHRLSGGSVLAYVEFFLNIEQNELKEYFQIMNGTLQGASMSEIGLVYAADLPNTLDNGRQELAAAELLAKITSESVSMSQEGNSRVIQYRVYAR